jgi:hypothetical protein
MAGTVTLGRPAALWRTRRIYNYSYQSSYKMKILYTGIGAKQGGIHTEQEFLDIMKKEFVCKDWNKDAGQRDLGTIIQLLHQLQFKDWVLPDDFIFFTLNDWIEYSGANVTS